MEVFIKDQNDNAPFFPKPLYQLVVAEDQYRDTPFAYVEADDPDESMSLVLCFRLAVSGCKGMTGCAE